MLLYKVIIQNNQYSNISRLKFKLENLTKGINYEWKTVLDLG